MLNVNSYNPPALVNTPVALSAQWLYGISNSDTLNPKNAGQVSPTCCLKPVRAVARCVLTAVGTLFASVIGTFYHTLSAILFALSSIVNNNKEHLKRAEQHTFAALVDCGSTLIDIFTVGYMSAARGLSMTSTIGCANWTAEHFMFTEYSEQVRQSLYARG